MAAIRNATKTQYEAAMQDLFLIALCMGLLAGILSGLPVAFVLMGVPLLTAFLGAALGVFDLAFLAAFPARVFGLLTNPVLVSVPLFVLMGSLLERSDVARRMMLTAGALFGEARGGMAYAVIIVGALLAASTGVIAATIFMMGLIALPAMAKGRYHDRLSAGVICASGSLGQIIPPSILLILLADQISSAYQAGRRAAGDWAPDPVSVGDLFAGAMVPGLLLVGLYLLYVFLVSIVRPQTCPPVRAAQIRDEGGSSLGAWDIVQALVAPLLLIALVLGSILGGVATPTESAALGASGVLILIALKRAGSGRLRLVYFGTGCAALALLMLRATAETVLGETGVFRTFVGGVAFIVLIGGLLAAVYQEIAGGTLLPAAKATAEMVASILMIVIGAVMLSLVFRGFGGEERVAELLQAVPGGGMVALAVVMALIFVLGFILEYVEIIFIVVPIAGPPLMASGIDPIWLAILISLNLQTSFMTPPFGYALFYFRSVAPASLATKDIYMSIVPFVIIQLIALAMVVIFPNIVTWLPEAIYS